MTKKKKILKSKGVATTKEVIVLSCSNNFFNLVNLFFVRWSATHHLVFQKMVLYLHSCNSVYVHVSYDILVVSSFGPQKNSPVSGFIGNFSSSKKQTIIGIWRVEKKARFT